MFAFQIDSFILEENDDEDDEDESEEDEDDKSLNVDSGDEVNTVGTWITALWWNELFNYSRHSVNGPSVTRNIELTDF